MCENLFYAHKRLEGARKTRRGWKIVCVLIRVKENGGNADLHIFLTNVCACDLQCQCMTCCNLVLFTVAKLASELNLTRSCLFMIAESLSSCSKSLRLGLTWQAVFCEKTLTFQARTGKDQDDQNRNKHALGHDCGPRVKEKKKKKHKNERCTPMNGLKLYPG